MTPDSFSDGSELAVENQQGFRVDLDKAMGRASAMVAEGAAIIDVGGESTRPGAKKVSIQEELDRVIPVIEAIQSSLDVGISVDTSSAEVMTAAIEAGAGLVNDIRALQQANSHELLANEDVAICLMHMKGEPRTMQDSIEYENVVEEVMAFLRDRVDDCVARGINRSRLIVDPGFGFGKSVHHNYRLLKNLAAFQSLDLPLLIGVSRKSMIGKVVDRTVEHRLAGSIAAATLALQGGANIIRTHDVAATVDAIRVNSAFSSA